MAISREAILLTHDLDFGKLLAFSGMSAPSVVIFRMQRLDASGLTGALEKNWALIEKPPVMGAIIAIEKNDVRIRRLPIGEMDPLRGLSAHEPQAVYGAKIPFVEATSRNESFGYARPKGKKVRQSKAHKPKKAKPRSKKG